MLQLRYVADGRPAIELFGPTEAVVVGELFVEEVAQLVDVDWAGLLATAGHIVPLDGQVDGGSGRRGHEGGRWGEVSGDERTTGGAEGLEREERLKEESNGSG